VLSSEHANVCRAFAMKGGDKFTEIDWHSVFLWAVAPRPALPH
jgi:hypothetical protein